MVGGTQPPHTQHRVLHVGCPMWANRDWVGRYFPADTPQGRELHAYAQWCNAVEGNTTFYSQPAEATVDRWAELTPPGFRFVFKLPRHVTHERRLRAADEHVAQFCARLTPIRDRLGPLWVQLPASFGPDDLPVLARFVRTLPDTHQWAVEVRHPAYAPGGDAERELNDMLADAGVDRVVLDSRALFAAAPSTPEERAAWEAKPRLGVRPVATGSSPIVRIIGQSGAAPTVEYWQPWVPKVAAWIAEGRKPFVFVHTPDNLISPELARRFHAEVSAACPGLEPLPDPPAQLALW